MDENQTERGSRGSVRGDSTVCGLRATSLAVSLPRSNGFWLTGASPDECTEEGPGNPRTILPFSQAERAHRSGAAASCSPPAAAVCAGSFRQTFWWLWSGGAGILRPALLHSDGLPLPLTDPLGNAAKELRLRLAAASALLGLRRG